MVQFGHEMSELKLRYDMSKLYKVDRLLDEGASYYGIRLEELKLDVYWPDDSQSYQKRPARTPRDRCAYNALRAKHWSAHLAATHRPR